VSSLDPVQAHLLLQAMRKLQEPSQIVQCRQSDISVVEATMPKAQQRYKQTYSEDAPQLTLDRKHFLPKAAATQAEDEDPDHPTWCAILYYISSFACSLHVGSGLRTKSIPNLWLPVECAMATVCASILLSSGMQRCRHLRGHHGSHHCCLHAAWVVSS
jgi:ATP synthase (E/31 kDa) subunit